MVKIDPKTATTQIGRLILATRRRQHLTQNQLADQVHRCGYTIAKIERGKTYSAFEDIVVILDRLGFELVVQERPHTDAP